MPYGMHVEVRDGHVVLMYRDRVVAEMVPHEARALAREVANKADQAGKDW